jgi:signal transduction histidine kinase
MQSFGRFAMKKRAWLVLALGLTALIALIAIFGYAAIVRAQQIESEIMAIHESYLRTDSYLRDIATEMDRAGLLVRDYLLDPSPTSAAVHRQQLLEIQSPLDEQLSTLEQNLGADATPALKRLRAEVQAYWESLDPIFEWTPKEKASRGEAFLQKKVLPSWHAVVELGHEIMKVNAANVRAEQQRLQASGRRLQSFLRRMLMICLGLGVVVAFLSIQRFVVLENRADAQRGQIENAEQELRMLSRSLVLAQETERKALSRELHDAVGQTLTGLSMELGNLEIDGAGLSGGFRDHLEAANRLNHETLRLVRDLAMGLRPAMLDDIGLAAALEWQGRQFSRQSGVPVSVDADGELDGLPETHRTCIFRVVQEALTNCARHANAKNIRVSVHGADDTVSVTIEDDGLGFDPEGTLGSGIGLVGLRERVRELNGSVTIQSRLGDGTSLRVSVPVEREVTA